MRTNDSDCYNPPAGGPLKRVVLEWGSVLRSLEKLETFRPSPVLPKNKVLQA